MKNINYIGILMLVFSNINLFGQWARFTPGRALPTSANSLGCREGDGTPIYIARAPFDNNGLHIGKTRRGDESAFIPYNGIENIVSNQVEVFTGNGRWSRPTSNEIPNNAFYGGYQYNTEKQFVIARADLGNGKGIHPGKATIEDGRFKAFIPYGGEELILNLGEFEILLHTTTPAGTNFTIVPNVVRDLCPNNLVRGDAEFGGGPFIRIGLRVLVQNNTGVQKVMLQTNFYARERGADESTLDHRFNSMVYTVPLEYKIIRINSNPTSELNIFDAPRAGSELPFGCNDGDVIVKRFPNGVGKSIRLIADTGAADISDDLDCSCDSKILQIILNSIGLNITII